MTCRFGSRATVSTVTLVAVTITTGVVDPGTAEEGCGSMTGAAIQSSRKVGRVGLGSHTFRCNTIMTRSAIVHDAGMIKHRTDEAAGCMTDATILICWYMGV